MSDLHFADLAMLAIAVVSVSVTVLGMATTVIWDARRQRRDLDRLASAFTALIAELAEERRKRPLA
jgi:hypothetical protein